MRPAQEWTEHHLVSLIEHKFEEGMQLEFKRAEALERTEKKKAEISKDVSAFANSIGGTIVYGMEESRKPPHYATALSPIEPETITKEWLEQVINSRIQPRISGILIQPIELRAKHPGKFVYAVIVPESTTAHQASDNKYYKRFNFESVPMEDYEVRQTMNRAARPAYTIQLMISSSSMQGSLKKLRFAGMLENVGDIVAHEVSTVLFVPKKYVRQPDEYSINYRGEEYSRIGATYEESSTSLRSAVESAHPLTPYSIDFRKSIFVPEKEHFLGRSFVVQVRVFDQFGIALKATFTVQPQDGKVRPMSEEPESKRTPSSLAAGELN